MKEFKNYWYRV